MLLLCIFIRLTSSAVATISCDEALRLAASGKVAYDDSETTGVVAYDVLFQSRDAQLLVYGRATRSATSDAQWRAVRRLMQRPHVFLPPLLGATSAAALDGDAVAACAFDALVLEDVASDASARGRVAPLSVALQPEGAAIEVCDALDLAQQFAAFLLLLRDHGGFVDCAWRAEHYVVVTYGDAVDRALRRRGLRDLWLLGDAAAAADADAVADSEQRCASLNLPLAVSTLFGAYRGVRLMAAADDDAAAFAARVRRAIVDTQCVHVTRDRAHRRALVIHDGVYTLPLLRSIVRNCAAPERLLLLLVAAATAAANASDAAHLESFVARNVAGAYRSHVRFIDDAQDGGGGGGGDAEVARRALYWLNASHVVATHDDVLAARRPRFIFAGARNESLAALAEYGGAARDDNELIGGEPLWCPRVGAAGDDVCLPYFINIGVHKCGTQSFLNYIRLHRQSREVHYWDDASDAHTLAEYAARLPRVRPGARNSRGEPLVVGEKTPRYFGQASPALLAATLPSVRLVVVVRAPTERAFSHYAHMAFRAAMNWGPLRFATFEEALRNSLTQLDAVHARCGRGAPQQASLAALTACFERAPRGHLWLSEADALEHPSDMLVRGVYVVWLRRWARHFAPRRRLLVLDSAHFWSQPAATMCRVTRFLRLTPMNWTSALTPSVLNTKAGEKAGTGVGNMSDAQRALLDAFYRSANEKLYEEFGIDLRQQ